MKSRLLASAAILVASTLLGLSMAAGGSTPTVRKTMAAGATWQVGCAGTGQPVANPSSWPVTLTCAANTTTTTRPSTTTTTPSVSPTPPGIPGRLAWSDEFTGPAGAPPNPATWDPLGFWYQHGKGVGNETVAAGQSRLDGLGHLALTAARQPDGTWLSGMVNSSPHGATPGYAVSAPFYVEFGATLPPAGAGLWPALWLLHNDGGYTEEDLMESVGDPTKAWASWVPPTGPGTSTQYGGVDLSKTEHSYGAYVTATSVTFYLDANKIATDSTGGNTIASSMIVIDLAVGGLWPGQPNAQTPSPASLTVDYVRVFA